MIRQFLELKNREGISRATTSIGLAALLQPNSIF
jgi:hypothetical protein